MKTTKPISFITYNTDAFLKMRLDSLVTQHIIEFYAFIRHKGEMHPDKKTGELVRGSDHIHGYIKPNRSIDTMELMTLLIEPDPDPNKTDPLKPFNFNHSKWDDWYLYSSHNSDYLETKLEIREFAYSDEEFITSNVDEFENMCYTTYHESKYVFDRNLMNYLDNGGSLQTLVRKGVIKPSQCFSYINFDKLYRGEQYHE